MVRVTWTQTSFVEAGQVAKPAYAANMRDSHPLRAVPDRADDDAPGLHAVEQIMAKGTLDHLHILSYYDAMAMTSLNISLPAALKDYVERQVASGDWGTPSEYVRELIRQDKERRLGGLEQELIAAAQGGTIQLPVAEIRSKGLVAALRQRARRR